MTPVALDAKTLAAERWFGYGRWDGPYWFIGKEPGGTNDPENYASWTRLGARELIDCREHDVRYMGPNRGKWHLGPRPPLQPTWRALIALLLAFQSDDPYDREEVRKYQANRWGRSDGETAVLELSAVASPSTASYDDLRLRYVSDRINVFRKRIAQHSPRFVVMYGTGVDHVNDVPYLSYWSRIAGQDLEVNTPTNIGKTAFVAVPHPTAHGLTTEFWTSLGRRLRYGGL